MILPDINVLIYAFREDVTDHMRYKAWLKRVIQGHEAYGLCDAVLSGFLRIVTHPSIFKTPTPLANAVSLLETLLSQPHCVRIAPSPGHWEIFLELCRQTQARGNHVTDAYLAALVIDSGSELITVDRDFSRYPGLRWRHPLA